jgi:hypothetical protein
MKSGLDLLEEDPERFGQILLHPLQDEVFDDVRNLLSALRVAHTPRDLYEFQRQLFGSIYELEEARGELVRKKKRVLQGKEPPRHRDQLEIDLAAVERGIRQLRSVGDALAWKAFRFDRRVFLALSRNERPGPMVGKEGLANEIGAVVNIWEENKELALMHDLTNCLRIADITHFTKDRPILKEVKATKERVPTKQLRRMQAAVDTINLGSPIRSRGGDTWLFRSAHQFKSHLSTLRGLVPLADAEGVACARIMRQWVVSCFSPRAAVVRKDPFAHLEKGRKVKEKAFGKAELHKAQHHLHGVQLGVVAIDPALAPIGIYPFDVETCARLICDFVIYESTLGFNKLAEALEAEGFRVDCLLPEGSGRFENEGSILRAAVGDKSLIVHGWGMNQLLLELVDLRVFAAALREVLDFNHEDMVSGVITFSNERAVWK